MNSYQAACMNLDSDGPQYISSNTGDEQSHASFLQAYFSPIYVLARVVSHAG